MIGPCGSLRDNGRAIREGRVMKKATKKTRSRTITRRQFVGGALAAAG